METQGWTRRSIAAEPRLGEIVDLYRELGFEVLLETLDEDDLDQGCNVCYVEDRERYRVVYTRPGACESPDHEPN